MDWLRLLNITASLLALPPIFYLVTKLNRVKANEANRLIKRMLYGFLVIAVLNTVVSLFSVVGLNGLAHDISLTVRTITSTIISFIAWAMYFTSKDK